MSKYALLDMLVIALISGCALAESGSSSTVQGDHVSLLTSGDPHFDDWVNKDFADIAASSSFEPFRPLAAYLVNGTGLHVKAYVVKWRLVRSGMADSFYKVFMVEQRDPGALSGETDILNPLESHLLTPWFDWTNDHFELQDKERVLNAFTRLLSSPQYRRLESVTISLDSTVYSNGTIVGEDSYGFGEHYQGERNGEREEALTLSKFLEQESDEDALSKRLARDVERCRKAAQGNPNDWFTVGEGREAAGLSNLLHTCGLPCLSEVVSRLSAAHKTLLVVKQ